MAQAKNVWKELLNNLLASLKTIKRKPVLIGEDYMGTKYYETPIVNSGSLRKSSRLFVTRGDILQQEIPPEWSSWLSHKRKDPPTDEEIQLNLLKMNTVIAKAKKLDSQYNKSNNKVLNTVKSEFPKYEEFETTPYKNNSHIK